MQQGQFLFRVELDRGFDVSLALQSVDAKPNARVPAEYAVLV